VHPDDDRQIRPHGKARASILGVTLLLVGIMVVAVIVARNNCLSKDGNYWYWMPPVGCENLED
jgi:hypothetical protein